jgi:hypothetical protein
MATAKKDKSQRIASTSVVFIKNLPKDIYKFSIKISDQQWKKNILDKCVKWKLKSKL